MTRSLFLLTGSLVFSLFLLTLMAGAAPVIGVPAAAAASVGRYQKFELRVPVTGTSYTNAYNYTVSSGGALLRATFTAPSGTVKVVDGFYLDGYSLTNATTGELTAIPAQNGWLVRFAPTETGQWSYSLTFQDAGGTSPARTGSFTATASADPGFVRRQAGKNYLRFDDNTSYMPVGENVCWGGNNRLGDYKVWLDKLSANRANCIRVWLCYWGMELEWKNIGWGGYNGLKKYSQAPAYELDWLLDYCAQHGIYLELCLNNHGQFQAAGEPDTQWADNPYNAANGGPCTTSQPWSFFTNTTAKNIYKNKLRYLVARYGYSKNLLDWELCNEMDLVSNYANATTRAATATWSGEMAAYLKRLDVNQHLVSNSYALNTGDATVWNNVSIDFTQMHHYAKRLDLERPLADASTALRAAHNKPFLTGEFGLETANGLTMGDDPNGIHFRNTLWATAFNGSMGAGLTWYWAEYIHSLNAKTYPVMLRLRNFLDANVNVVADSYQPVAPELATPTGLTMSVVPGFSGFQPPAYSATKAPANSFVVNRDGTIAPAESSLGMHLFGNWNPNERSAPTFQVNYPAAGQFRVHVASIGASATLVIKLNGVVKLTQVNPAAGGTYSISVPAGAATITLDNIGNDWLQLASLDFTNYQSRLVGQALRDGERVVGYVRNRDYNWQYFLDHNQTAPASVIGGTLTVRSLTPGVSYALNSTNCATGTVVATKIVTATAAGTITVALPTVAWDVAFVLQPTGAPRPLGTTEVTALATSPTTALPELALWPNPAHDAATVALADATPGPVSYQLFDQLGRLQWQATDPDHSVTPRQYTLPLEQVPAGCYLLRVSSPAGQRTTRLVVAP